MPSCHAFVKVCRISRFFCVVSRNIIQSFRVLHHTVTRSQDRRAATKIEPDKTAWTFEQVDKIAATKNNSSFEIAYAKIA